MKNINKHNKTIIVNNLWTCYKNFESLEIGFRNVDTYETQDDLNSSIYLVDFSDDEVIENVQLEMDSLKKQLSNLKQVVQDIEVHNKQCTKRYLIDFDTKKLDEILNTCFSIPLGKREDVIKHSTERSEYCEKLSSLCYRTYRRNS